jgi:hypothetical protein
MSRLLIGDLSFFEVQQVPASYIMGGATVVVNAPSSVAAVSATTAKGYDSSYGAAYTKKNATASADVNYGAAAGAAGAAATGDKSQSVVVETFAVVK